MKALVFHRPKKVSVEWVKDPIIEDDRDIIVKVTSTAICGSDLRIYNRLLSKLLTLTPNYEFLR